MYPLYSRHVSALILGHHQVNFQNFKKNHCSYNGSVVSNLFFISSYLLVYGLEDRMKTFARNVDKLLQIYRVSHPK
jgi:hypothetical protein